MSLSRSGYMLWAHLSGTSPVPKSPLPGEGQRVRPRCRYQVMFPLMVRSHITCMNFIPEPEYYIDPSLTVNIYYPVPTAYTVRTCSISVVRAQPKAFHSRFLVLLFSLDNRNSCTRKCIPSAVRIAYCYNLVPVAYLSSETGIPTYLSSTSRWCL